MGLGEAAVRVKTGLGWVDHGPARDEWSGYIPDGLEERRSEQHQVRNQRYASTDDGRELARRRQARRRQRLAVLREAA